MIGKITLIDKDYYVYCDDCLYGGRETDTCSAPAGILKLCAEMTERLYGSRAWENNPDHKDSRTWKLLSF